MLGFNDMQKANMADDVDVPLEQRKRTFSGTSGSISNIRCKRMRVSASLSPLRTGSTSPDSPGTKRRRSHRHRLLRSPPCTNRSRPSPSPVAGGLLLESVAEDENSMASSISAYDLQANNGEKGDVSGAVPMSSEDNDVQASCVEVSMDCAATNVDLDVVSNIDSRNSDPYTNANMIMPQKYLRSHARLEELKQRRQQLNSLPKSFTQLPPEVYCKVFYYLSVQDLFRTMRVNKTFYAAVIKYLKLVKRINFSAGLPFAFLPHAMGDKILRSILVKSPRVTHILGFYPRHIYDSRSHAQVNNETGGVFTYAGIMSAFRCCSRLRSVEIMDVELMTRVVNSLPRVKFHGMFRNRPDGWDDEYSALPSSRGQQGGVSPLSFSMSPARSATYSQRSPVSSNSSGGLQSFNVIPPYSDRVVIPANIHNLTKLDLMSVCVPYIPRMENIKYLHLKWVRFSTNDPFSHFVAPKLQSFVMNNCVGPTRALRYIRILSALIRAPHLSRLELVSFRFVMGLTERLIEDMLAQGMPPPLCHLQRLVMTGNQSCSETDLGYLLISAQDSLCHLALICSRSSDSLFFSLFNSRTILFKLDTLILGYQDPFQSRFSKDELETMNLVENYEETVCSLTDKGVCMALRCCPRLATLHIKEAHNLERPVLWTRPSWVVEAGDRDAEGAGWDLPPYRKRPELWPLKSLTLEKCPAIRAEALEELLNGSNQMPQLETLVLRDMLPSLPKDSDPIKADTLDHVYDVLSPQRNTEVPLQEGDDDPENLLGLLPGGMPHGLNNTMIWRRFVRMLRFVYQLDVHGEVPDENEMDTESQEILLAAGLGRPFLYESVSYYPMTSTSARRWTRRQRNLSQSRPEVAFHSRGSQTCLCAKVEWEYLHQLADIWAESRGASGQSSHQQQSTAGPSSAAGAAGSEKLDCPVCQRHTSDEKEYISSDCDERHMHHQKRQWSARDACVDTTSLHLYLAPPKHTFTINTEDSLTTLHLEKVGITHLLLENASKLKNLTLENCPEIQAIVVPPHARRYPGHVLRSLRRVRIVRCPKIAIYHLLHTVTTLYPDHDENLYITYRPFGEYNSLVEQVLWYNLPSAHVLVSHDRKKKSSEREMEEMRSSFDQLFREVLNFSETLIKREIVTAHDYPGANSFSNGTFMRSEHGEDWDMTTDIPWISEVCCSMLPNDMFRSEQPDQLYELLAEIQASSPQLKLRRRGVHFHVQCRDIHPVNYLPEPYTDEYVSRTHPLADLNAFNTETPVLHRDIPAPPNEATVGGNQSESETEEGSGSCWWNNVIF